VEDHDDANTSKSTSRSPPDTIHWKSRAVRDAVAAAATTDTPGPVTAAVLITETAA
jgi:hypothetical protein